MPDFNGDGRDDILWWGANGAVSNWLGQQDGGFHVNDAAALTMVDPGGYWEILGTGDFNGDGNSDILWINDGFQMSNWLGTQDTGAFAVNDANALTSYEGDYFAGSGDFDGDGYDDLLWWDYWYSVSTWSGTETGGFVKNPASPITTNSGDWIPFGVGDFNGDGLDDILWQNLGIDAVSNWLSTGDGGFTVNDANAFHQVPDHWLVIGVGDFNGDGYDDILWYHSQDLPGDDPPALLSNWLGTETGGFIVNDANALVVVPQGWFVAGVGDYDGDGRSDVLWRNEGGAVSNWLGTETGGWVINDAAAYAQVETSWQIGSNWDPWDY